MMKNSETPVLKLNYRRTALIGFAFFGILLLWQVYDSWCPTFLTDIFARSIYDLSSAELKASAPEKLLHVQWIVGIIMACDNLAALILLPIFGNLSDRTRTPIGKRMPYILVGTFVSALAFPFIPLFFHRNNILGMVTMMAVVLLFMMMYRNPAVSLMPDITPKPQSQRHHQHHGLLRRGLCNRPRNSVCAQQLYQRPRRRTQSLDH